MRHRHVLLIVIPLAAGACAEVLGLDEPIVRKGGSGGGSTTGTTAPATTGTDTSSTSGGGGPGGSGPGSGGGTGATGGGGSGGCAAHGDCEDANPCTIDVCSDGACVNEASGTDPADDPDDCVDVTCAGDVPTVTPDDTEVAAHPNPPCHMGSCQGGVVVDVFADESTPCGDPPLVCDGAGSCIGCTNDVDCSGADGPCSVPVCQPDGVCDPGILEQGTVVDDPAGNCKAAVCTGASSTPNLAYDPDDLPAPITCAVITCKPEGPEIRAANDGVPCTVGEFTGVCAGNQTGDDACVECEEQRDCDLHESGGRCFGTGTCGCSFGGDCDGFWRAGSVCVASAGDDVCGCNVANDCRGNMHGSVCIGAACGCSNAGHCAGAELGLTCIAGEARCGCTTDAECSGSQLGLDCLAAGMRCGCNADADCPPGSTCLESLGVCL